MQQPSLPTIPLSKRVALAAMSCCALIGVLLAESAAGQALASNVDRPPPANPLRSGAGAATATIRLSPPEKVIQQVQAAEPLPAPRLPGALPREASVLAPMPQPEQYLEGDPSYAWPADAPAHHEWGGHLGRGQHAYTPREPWFAHGDPNDPARHTGWGQPLTGTSWLNRPWYAGLFIGGMLADDLVAGHVEADSAPFLGLRLGNDFDHFWGWEIRYAYSRTELFTGAGVPIVEPGREYFVDVALLYYPWGDSHWRPYLLAGVGFMNARYVNDTNQMIDDTALTLPLGVGLKLYHSPWFTIRFDAVDNLSFAGGHLDAMHNVALMVGAEFRFGGRRPSYFPWSGNTSYW